jgi:G3E family GTPase
MTDPILAPGPRLDPIESPTGAPVPVTLLTGFLGAGKTTLLNRILTGDHGLKVGVLVNDFGAVNIDADLIEGVEENTISLSNGCVCCEVRDDLVTSLEDLLSAGREIEYVILEASGVADPEGIVMTFLEARYEHLLQLDSITCVVDAEGLFAHRDDAALTHLKLRQIGFADLVILNKVDLVGPENVRLVEDWIGSYFNRVRIVPTSYADAPYEILLSVGRFDPSVTDQRHAGDGPDAEHDHEPAFETWHYRRERPLSEPKLQETLRGLPAWALRAKGFVHTAESPEDRMLAQTVGRRVSITSMGPWGDRDRVTDIVVIATRGSLNPDVLHEAFDACRA